MRNLLNGRPKMISTHLLTLRAERRPQRHGQSSDDLAVERDGINITIDLNGHTIYAANGPGDHAGIHLMDVTGVTVKNGTVRGFDAGIWIMGGSGNTVSNVTAVDNINDQLAVPCNLGDGIAIDNSSGNTVVGSRLIHNGPYGGVSVFSEGGDNNVIKGNDVRDNNIVSRSGSGCGNSRQDEGIRIEGPGADGNRVEKNTVTNSLLSGIGLHGYVCNDDGGGVDPPNQGTVIIGNKVSHTAGTPIAAGINFLDQGPDSIVCPAFNSTIVGNNSSNNQADGIFVDGNSKNNTISSNTVNENGLDGIFLGGPSFANVFTNLGGNVLDLVSPDRPPYVEGTSANGADYRVMSGSGSGDVTAELVAIDVTLAPGADATSNPQPVDTSTSGCEQADYDAAGFTAGDVALIQRGTCTFVSKVNLAIANGASAVVMFNEGQVANPGTNPDRRTANFGGVGPVPIPVTSTSYSVGYELYNLTQADTVTIHVVTNTTNEMVKVADGAEDNILKGNRGHDNAVLDAEDENENCDNNKWTQNRFTTVNQKCVAAGGGTGWVGGPGGADTRPDSPPGLERNAALGG